MYFSDRYFTKEGEFILLTPESVTPHFTNGTPVIVTPVNKRKSEDDICNNVTKKQVTSNGLISVIPPPPPPPPPPPVLSHSPVLPPLSTTTITNTQTIKHNNKKFKIIPLSKTKQIQQNIVSQTVQLLQHKATNITLSKKTTQTSQSQQTPVLHFNNNHSVLLQNDTIHSSHRSTTNDESLTIDLTQETKQTSPKIMSKRRSRKQKIQPSSTIQITSIPYTKNDTKAIGCISEESKLHYSIDSKEKY